MPYQFFLSLATSIPAHQGSGGVTAAVPTLLSTGTVVKKPGGGVSPTTPTVSGISSMPVTYASTIAAECNGDPIVIRTVSDQINAMPTLFTGIVELDIESSYAFQPYLVICQADPLPMTILSITTEVTIE